MMFSNDFDPGLIEKGLKSISEIFQRKNAWIHFFIFFPNYNFSRIFLKERKKSKFSAIKIRHTVLKLRYYN
jgi:hypothetical protein